MYYYKLKEVEVNRYLIEVVVDNTANVESINKSIGDTKIVQLFGTIRTQLKAKIILTRLKS